MVTPRAQHVTAVKKHRTLRKRGRYWRAGRQPSYEELREAAEDHTKLYTMPSPVDRDRVMNCSTPDIRPAGKAATTSSRVLLRSGLRRYLIKRYVASMQRLWSALNLTDQAERTSGYGTTSISRYPNGFAVEA